MLKPDKLWVRFGDASGYEEVTEEHIMNDIFDPTMIGEFKGWVKGGLVTTFHEGNDYISMFWGKTVDCMSRELSWIEKDYFQDLIQNGI